jgi:hypothetical protein
MLSELVSEPTSAEVAELIDKSADNLGDSIVESFDLGMGIRSSLVSLTRDAAVDPREYWDYVLALGRDALWLYRLTQELIRRERFDIVILFNGRFAPVRAIRRACEALGTRYFIHERGSSTDKYALFDCATPHQPSSYRAWVDAWWAYADGPERNAGDFLMKRRRGIATNWYSFTRNQKPGIVQPRSHRKRITFFTSSEDEFAAIGDELRSDTPFCDQVTAIRSIGAMCRARGYELIIRFHPNTAASAISLMKVAREATPFVIEPWGSADSYALADSSDVVFSQNSTIAIEAAATGKLAYFTGRSIYEACRSVPRITTENELSEAIERCGGADPLDALKYANFLGTHGIKYVYYKPNGILSGTYLGRNLNSPLATIRDLKLRITRGGR